MVTHLPVVGAEKTMERIFYKACTYTGDSTLNHMFSGMVFTRHFKDLAAVQWQHCEQRYMVEMGINKK